MSQELLIYLKQAQDSAAQGNWEKAGQFYLKALNSSPDNPDILNDLGLVFKKLGGINQALECFRKILAIDPNHKAAAANLGNLLLGLGELDEAEGWLRIALSQDNPRSWSNLGTLFQAKGELNQAFKAYEKALKIKPDFAEILNNMGVVRQAQGEPLEAIKYFRQAIDLQPDFVGAFRNLLLGTIYKPQTKPEEYARLCREFAEYFPYQARHVFKPRKRAKIRLGYVSSDFRNHPVARNLELIFQHHDRQKFELYCYGDIEIPTPETTYFAKAADRWLVTTRLGDLELAKQIYQDEVDILIILAGRFDSNRPQLARFKPAPVIVSFHEVASLGLPEIDYLITDRILHPRGSPEYFAERPLHLPWFYIHKPLENASESGELPFYRNGFVTFGSFNNPAKLNDQVLQLWARLLDSIPHSKLSLKYKNCFKDQGIRQRIARIMGSNFSRIIFLHNEDDIKNHLGLYKQVDIALDPFPFSGSTTSFEALSMGVPVVTWAQDSMVSRWTASILKTLGHKEWIATSESEYLTIAQNLAGNPVELAEIRHNLGKKIKNSRLCQGTKFTRHYERLLQQIACRNPDLIINILSSSRP